MRLVLLIEKLPILKRRYSISSRIGNSRIVWLLDHIEQVMLFIDIIIEESHCGLDEPSHSISLLLLEPLHHNTTLFVLVVVLCCHLGRVVPDSCRVFPMAHALVCTTDCLQTGSEE